MPDSEEPENTEVAAPVRRRHFRSSDRPKLAPDAATRQGHVTRLAFEALGKDTAIAYLNLENAGLGGRPLDIATASADGLRLVQLDLAALPGRA